jgi:hypothetical protein
MTGARTSRGRRAVVPWAETDRMNPKFVYRDFPYCGKIADRAFAEKLGSEEAPSPTGPERTCRL